jgi:hypothetical protein
MNISNANAIADFDSDQYQIYAMDMGSNDDNNNNYYYKSNDYDNVLVNNNIKCNNINANVNGFNGATLPTSLIELPTYDVAQAADEVEVGASSFGSDVGRPSGSDKDFRFVCINNNNNNNVVEGEETPTPTPQTASLTVNKEIFGCKDIETDPITGKVSMDCRLLQNNDEGWMKCDEIPPSGRSICDALPENLFDIRVLDDQNIPIADDIVGSELGTTIQNIEPGTYTVNELKNPTSNINQLGENPDLARICINNNDFTDGGELINQNEDLDYNICLEYEDQPGNAQGDDCSTITLAAGEEKTCTVKNYIIVA